MEPIAPLSPLDSFDAPTVEIEVATWLATFADGTEEYLSAADLEHAISISPDLATLELCI